MSTNKKTIIPSLKILGVQVYEPVPPTVVTIPRLPQDADTSPKYWAEFILPLIAELRWDYTVGRTTVRFINQWSGIWMGGFVYSEQKSYEDLCITVVITANGETPFTLYIMEQSLSLQCIVQCKGRQYEATLPCFGEDKASVKRLLQDAAKVIEYMKRLPALQQEETQVVNS